MSCFPNRTNLDPWDQYSDAQIWEALEKTHIKEMVSDNMVRHCQIELNDASLEQNKPVTFVLIPLFTPLAFLRSASCLTRSTPR